MVLPPEGCLSGVSNKCPAPLGLDQNSASLFHVQLLKSHSPLSPLEVVLCCLCKVSFRAYAAKDLATNLQEMPKQILGAMSLLRPPLWSPILQVAADFGALAFIFFSSTSHTAALGLGSISLHVRPMPQAESRHESGPHPVCIPSLQNYSPVTSTAQCLRIVVHICCPVLQC